MDENYCQQHDIFDCPFAHDPRDGRVVATYESKSGKVVVYEREQHLEIVGGSKIWWQQADNGDEQPWGRFTATFRRCDHAEGVLTKDWPVCTNMHTGRNCQRKCHEMGHVERVEAFAQKALRTY